MYLTKELYLKQISEFKTSDDRKHGEGCDIITDDYWQSSAEIRWRYMSIAIDLLKLLKPSKIIETGTNGIKLNSESIELLYPEQDLDFPPYRINGKVINNNDIDCFVALQVWEHLNNPREAFIEAARISKHVLLSLPYQWDVKDDYHHNRVNRQLIDQWTKPLKPEFSQLIKSENGKTDRIVLLYNTGLKQ